MEYRAMVYRAVARIYPVLMALVILGLMPGVASAQFAGGSGTEADPYQIETWTQLQEINNHMSSHFVLNNDLTEATDGYATLAGSAANEGKGWQPIGDAVCEDESAGNCMMYREVRFSGSLDGQGYTIDKLTINRPNGYPENASGGVGLFMALEGATVENLSLTNVNVTGGASNTGAIAGITYPEGGFGGAPPAIIDRVFVSGNVTGGSQVGGLVGFFQGATIKQSSVNINLTITNGFGGGFVGYMVSNVTIENSYANGVVTGTLHGGGLVGSLFRTGDVATLRYNYSNVLVQTSGNEGGLIGLMPTGYNAATTVFTANFWNTSLANQATRDVGDISNNNVTPGIVGKTDAELRQRSTFETAGWDFENIWTIDEGNGYPEFPSAYTNLMVIDSFLPVQASAGDTVRVTGSGFQTVTAVSLGNVPVYEYIVRSDTEMDVVVAWGATGDLVLSDGTETRTASGFTFQPSRVYDFDNMPVGSIQGIDGWKSVPIGNSSASRVHEFLIPGVTSAFKNDLVAGHDGSTALRFPHEGSGIGSRATRVNNDQFRLISVDDDSAQYIFELEIGHTYWGVRFGVGQDANQDGDLNETGETGFRFLINRVGSKRTLYRADGSSIDGSGSFSAFNRYQFILDRAANNGAGAMSVYSKDLTTDDADWEAIPGLQNINMQFDAGTGRTNPANWDAFMFHSESAGPVSLYDNITSRKLSVSAETLDFDSLHVSLKQTQTITVQGEGLTGALTASLTGEYDFGDGTQSVSGVQNGSVLSVRFSPQSTGAKNGTLTLSGEDLAKPLTISLTGDAFERPALSGIENLTPILQTDTNNQGVLISELLGGHLETFGLPNRGVAIVGVDNSKGNWEVSTNGGSTWWSVDSPSETTATLLHADASTRIRFVPGLNFFGITPDTEGTAGVTLRGWNRLTDQGNRTQLFDITNPSVAGQFSTDSRTATITVTKVNQTPFITELGGESVLFFDGATSYLDLNDDMKLYRDQSFTVEAWLNITQIKNWQRFFDFGSGADSQNIFVAISEGMNGTPEFTTLNPNNSNKIKLLYSGQFPLNQWVHTAAVYDADVQYGTLYLQGRPVVQGPMVTGDGTPVRTNNYFFRSNFGQDAFTEGSMRQLRIWKKARTGQEIRGAMNEIITDPQPGLYANFHLDEGSGTTLQDRSGNNLSTTLVDPVWRTEQGLLSGMATVAGTSASKTIRILDIDHAVTDLQLSVVSSSDPSVLALSDVTITGSDTLRTITINPNPDVAGTTTLTLRADDQADANNAQDFALQVVVYASNQYTLSADTTAIDANNTDTVTFTAELLDGDSNSLPGLDVHFQVLSGDAGTGGLSAGPWTTDAQGRATATLTSSKAGTFQIAAFLGQDDQGEPIDTLTIAANAIFADGLGTADSPYQVANWNHLEAAKYYPAAHYQLTASLNSLTAGYDALASATANSASGWQPLGTDAQPFTGTFDGGGFTIQSLTIPASAPGTRPHAGLFGTLNGATVSNLVLADASVTGDDRAGALAAVAKGSTTVEQVAVVRGQVSSTASGSFSGGLIGELLADQNSTVTIRESSSTATVTASTPSGQAGSHAGGLVGKASSEAGASWLIRDNYAVSTIQSDHVAAGLIASAADGTLRDSYAAPRIQAATSPTTTSPATSAGITGSDPQTANVTIENTLFDSGVTPDLSDADSYGRTQTQMKSRHTFADETWDLDIETTNGADDLWTIQMANQSNLYISYPYHTWATYDTPGTEPAVHPIPGIESVQPIDLTFQVAGKDTSLFRPGIGSGTVPAAITALGYNSGSGTLLPQDFSYENMSVVYELIPATSSPISINTGTFHVHYDPARLSLIEATAGTFFPSTGGNRFFDTQTNNITGGNGQTLQNLIIDTGYLAENPNIALQNNTDPIARLEFRILKPGLTHVSVDSAQVSAFSEDLSGDLSIRFPAVSDSATVEFWPADVTSDGFVDFFDLTGFASSYFSRVNEPAYRIKYDFGSSASTSYYNLPVSDGEIGFRDLIVFATGYTISIDRKMGSQQMSGAQQMGGAVAGGPEGGGPEASTQTSPDPILLRWDVAETIQDGHSGSTENTETTRYFILADGAVNHIHAANILLSHPREASVTAVEFSAQSPSAQHESSHDDSSHDESSHDESASSQQSHESHQTEPEIFSIYRPVSEDGLMGSAPQSGSTEDSHTGSGEKGDEQGEGDEQGDGQGQTQEQGQGPETTFTEIHGASISGQSILSEPGVLFYFDLEHSSASAASSPKIQRLTLVDSAGNPLEVQWDASEAPLPSLPDLPEQFALHQNYPNPFNPSTIITYELPKQANVVLEVFSITGQRVFTAERGVQSAGTYSIQLDAGRWASGTYLYRLRTADFVQTRKMLLMK